jgi:hypothetical protein
MHAEGLATGSRPRQGLLKEVSGTSNYHTENLNATQVLCIVAILSNSTENIN